MPELIWSDAALRDLRHIDEYLTERNPDAGARILKAVRTKADQLRAYPLSGPLLAEQHRYLAVGSTPYVIIYVAGRERIEILRVRHGREDWRPQ